jgi:cell division initiation protein
MAKLTPLDIRRQEFKKAIRGYDVEEVRVFLEMLADQFEEMINENTEMRERLINLEAKVEEYVKNEENLNEILEQTRKLQENTLETLKQKEENIIKEAELKAVEILERARAEARQVREEMQRLQEKKDAFVQRLKYLLQSYIDLIQMLGMEQVIEPLQDEPGAARLTKGRGTSKRMQSDDSDSKIDEESLADSEDFFDNINEIIDKIDIPDEKPAQKSPSPEKIKKRKDHPDTKEETGLDEFPNLNDNLKLGE